MNTQTPNNQPPNNQTPVTGETQTLCITEGGYQGTTHVKYVFVYYSIKKKKYPNPKSKPRNGANPTMYS